MEITKIPKKRTMVLASKQPSAVDTEKYKQLQVAAYCRVSTDSEEQLTSYKTQMRVYSEMIAEKKEWAFAGLYADEGISGTRADIRPEFNRMINDCLTGKIDYIITKSVSRFARNTVDCLETVRILKKRGVGVFFEEQNIDTLKSDSELYLVIYAGFTQSESESISKNITWSYRKKFEDGKAIFVYKKLLGYRKGENDAPEIVPYEAEIVERIFDMFLSGSPVNVISQTLRSENIVIPGKNFSFSKGMIMNLLKNEKYCGDCILQKTVTVDCISKTRKTNEGEAPMYIVENNHPAIISREKFNRAQEELRRRNALTPKSKKNCITATGKYSKYALTEVLRCAECGSRYRRCTWTSHGKKRIVWRCINRLDFGKMYCPESLTVSEENLHNAIVRALNRLNEANKSTYLALMKATIGEALGLKEGSDEIDLHAKQIEALNNRMITMVDETVRNGGDIESNDWQFKEISDQIEQLKKRIEVLYERQSNDTYYHDRIQKIQGIIDQQEMHKYEYDDSVVRQMIECIKVHHDGKLIVIFSGGYEVEENLWA